MVWPAMFIMTRTNRELISEVNDRFTISVQKPSDCEEDIDFGLSRAFMDSLIMRFSSIMFMAEVARWLDRRY